jgi:ribonuclease P protein component
VIQAKAQNRSGNDHPPDRSLPRSKILRGKLNYKRLFERSATIKKSFLLCRYRVYTSPNVPTLFGFIAPKKVFRRAVDRNRAKRLLREAFRIHQHLLPESLQSNDTGLHAAFIITSKPISFADVEEHMISLLNLLSHRLAAERTSKQAKTQQTRD